ncbi:MAG: hypothetical protein Q8R08_00455 [bacterium]|nr:hypothetical protein [bacterium]
MAWLRIIFWSLFGSASLLATGSFAYLIVKFPNRFQNAGLEIGIGLTILIFGVVWCFGEARDAFNKRHSY